MKKDYQKVYIMSQQEKKDAWQGELLCALVGLGFILSVLL